MLDSCCAPCYVRTHMVVDAAAHNCVPGWGCATLLSWCEPLPGAALELQQDQQARKLRRSMVGQRTQDQLVDIVEVNPAEGQDKDQGKTVSTDLCVQWYMQLVQ